MRAAALRWCVVRTLPREENRAELNLLRQGYNAYCPRLKRQVRHARKTSWKMSPVFPGYLFVSIDPAKTQWRAIQSTFGVAGLVRFGDRPATLPCGLVETLRLRSGPDGLVSSPPLHVGDRVRVVGGAFDDWIGDVLSLPENDRVSLLLTAASRSIEVTFPISSTLLVPMAEGDAR